MSLANEIVKLAHKNGYRVTADGKLTNPAGTVVKTVPDTYGYLSKGMRVDNLLGKRGSPRRLMVHKLAAFQKFGDACFEKGIQVRHLDGNRKNNSPDNIKIGSASENSYDRPRKQRKEQAIIASQSLRKLTAPQIEELKRDRVKGDTYLKLCSKYGVAKSTVAYILNKS